MFDIFLRNAMTLGALGPMHDAWRWMDSATAATQAWIELQQALWQPCWDAQAQWLRQWSAAAMLPPELTTRGAEQLA